MRSAHFSTLLWIASLPLVVSACGDGTTAADAAAGLDAPVTREDTGVPEGDTGRDRADAQLELPDADLSLIDADFSLIDADLSLPDGTLLDRDGGLLDRDGGLLDRDSALLDRDAGLCGPMDARGDGACDLALGIVWNGTMCVSISGCSCVGAECGDIFRTEAACRLRYGACAGTAGAFACGPMRECSLASEYCAVANIGPAVRYTCEPLPATCLRDVSCASCFPRPGTGLCTGDAASGLTLDDGRG